MCVKLCRLNRMCWWRVSHKHCTGKWEDHDCRRWKPNTGSKMRGFGIVKFVFGLAVECHCICHSLLPSHPDEQILALVTLSEQDALANNTRQGLSQNVDPRHFKRAQISIVCQKQVRGLLAIVAPKKLLLGCSIQSPHRNSKPLKRTSFFAHFKDAATPPSTIMHTCKKSVMLRRRLFWP